MERHYRLTDGGSLTVRADELRAVAEVRRAEDGRGLYKAYLRGPSGRALLGTLAPEAGELRIRRTLTLDSLKRQGAWPPVGGETELAFPFAAAPPQGWRQVDPGSLSFGEEVLRSMAVRQGETLFRAEGAGFALAYPFSCARPFPLPALFCLARTVVLAGERYILYRFGADGWPVPTEKRGASGVC